VEVGAFDRPRLSVVHCTSDLAVVLSVGCRAPPGYCDGGGSRQQHEMELKLCSEEDLVVVWNSFGGPKAPEVHLQSYSALESKQLYQNLNRALPAVNGS